MPSIWKEDPDYDTLFAVIDRFPGREAEGVMDVHLALKALNSIRTIPAIHKKLHQLHNVINRQWYWGDGRKGLDHPETQKRIERVYNQLVKHEKLDWPLNFDEFRLIRGRKAGGDKRREEPSEEPLVPFTGSLFPPKDNWESIRSFLRSFHAVYLLGLYNTFRAGRKEAPITLQTLKRYLGGGESYIGGPSSASFREFARWLKDARLLNG